MNFENERIKMRQVFIDAWQKQQAHHILEPLERQLIDIIALHPDYQKALNDPEILHKEYSTEENPFLHMSLHLGFIEQLTTNRPQGIHGIYQNLSKKYPDEHHVQHLMMNVMAEVIWEAQQSNQLPNEFNYLNKLKKLISLELQRWIF